MAAISEAVKGTLVVDVHTASNLGFPDTVSDPYVILRVIPAGATWDSQFEWKSRVANKTRNPKWNDAFMIRFDESDVKGSFPLALEFLVQDRNLEIKSNTLGKTVVRIANGSDEQIGKRLRLPLEGATDSALEVTVSILEF